MTIVCLDSQHLMKMRNGQELKVFYKTRTEHVTSCSCNEHSDAARTLKTNFDKKRWYFNANSNIIVDFSRKKIKNLSHNQKVRWNYLTICWIFLQNFVLCQFHCILLEKYFQKHNWLRSFSFHPFVSLHTRNIKKRHKNF